MQRCDADVPVLIVGGGPVGLGLAVDLGSRGVPCLVVERTDGSFEFPRANAINVRTMEFCRRWGIAEEVRAAGVPPDFPHTAIYVTSLAGHEIARVERPTHGGGSRPSQHSPERPQRCNQMWFDPVLRGKAESFPHVRLRYRCRFESFEQDADGVVANVTDLASGSRERIATRYLVACCGGHSSVRSQLGIRLEGTPILGTPVHIFFRTPALWDHHDKGKAALTYLMGPRGRWATMVNVDGGDLWSLSVELDSHDRKISAEEARALVDRAIGTSVTYEIRSFSYWVRREMVASRYRQDRVFIAGDCAHLNGPEGGYGMNTGMGDAVDLGWKLAATLAGWGGPNLLASYEAERRPIAQRNVREATRNVRNHEFDAPDLLLETPEGQRQRSEMGARILRDGARRHGHDGLALGYRYDPSPICWPDGEAAPADDTARYVPSAHPGCRAPHVALAEGSSAEGVRSTLDLFGPGFTLLRVGERAPDPAPIVRAAERRGVPLDVHDLPGNDAVRDLYGRSLVLVRPDGHVAWRAAAAPADPLAVIDRVRGA
jgi:2-polyprenyl-6-methoxyphenol hydroxylase-like FAD-dependent oxidoreductase